MIRRTTAQGARRAFTLVELLIVILLIAILMAFIVPQFFGARQKAGDRVAQQTLRSAVATAKQFAQDNESYQTATRANLTQAEPNVVFVEGATASGKATTTARNADGSSSDSTGNSRSVSVAPDGQNLTLAAAGENGACWFVRLHYGSTAAGQSRPDEYGVAMNATSCTAAAMSTATGTSVTAQSNEFPGRS